MAKCKFGAFVVDIRGKSNGHVFTKNRGGACIRTKVSPTNPSSASQIAARARFATNAQGWRGLTAAQRQAWNTAVSDFKRTDVFGDIKSPSGINLYVRLNTQLALIGVAALTYPPLPSEVGRLLTMSAAAAHAIPNLDLTYTPAIPATTHMVVLATPALSPGRSFVKSDYRVIGDYVTADASPLDILPEYTAKFGAIGEPGQVIHFEAYWIDNNTGIVGSKISCSSVIGA